MTTNMTSTPSDNPKNNFTMQDVAHAIMNTSNEKMTMDERTLGQAHYRLGKIFFDKSDFQKAEKHFLKALDLCMLPEDGFPILKIAGFLVRIYSETLKKEDAANFIDVSKMVLDIMDAQKGISGAELAFFHGVVDTYLGHFEDAKKNFSLSYSTLR